MYSCYTELIEIELIICIKMDFALNDLQRLICHKTQPTFKNLAKPVNTLCREIYWYFQLGKKTKQQKKQRERTHARTHTRLISSRACIDAFIFICPNNKLWADGSKADLHSPIFNLTSSIHWQKQAILILST